MIEVTFYEDPACSWCWAFQPVATAFCFEYRHALRIRHVMGGLRDRPAADVSFITQLWKTAETVSGMPFDCAIWKKHELRTTFISCRLIKAASMVSEQAAWRLLRRTREAFYIEQTPIDDVELILKLGEQVGIDAGALRENVASGRAEALFARDRVEAAQHGFGFPTIVLRSRHQEEPLVLQGAVPYSDLLQALTALGLCGKVRRRFRDSPENWAQLFEVHPRLTFAEIQMVTGMEKSKLHHCLRELGFRLQGHFYEWPGRPPTTPVTSTAPTNGAAPPEPGGADGARDPPNSPLEVTPECSL